MTFQKEVRIIVFQQLGRQCIVHVVLHLEFMDADCVMVRGGMLRQSTQMESICFRLLYYYIILIYVSQASTSSHTNNHVATANVACVNATR